MMTAGFPRVIEVIQPIMGIFQARFAIFFSALELPVSRETAIANSRCDFSRNVIRYRVAGPLQKC